MKFWRSRHFNIFLFLFFFLFASLFLFEFIMFTQPYLWLYLLILSLIGILGITGSLFYEKRRWMYAIPSIIVVLLLIINYSIMVQNSTFSRPSYVPAILSEVLYLSLPIVVTILHIGLYVSGLKHAGSLALLTGALSIFPLSSLFQDLIKILNVLQGIPMMSSEDIVIFLYMLVIMPIIGVTILWEGYSLYKKRMNNRGYPLTLDASLRSGPMT